MSYFEARKSARLRMTPNIVTDLSVETETLDVLPKNMDQKWRR